MRLQLLFGGVGAWLIVAAVACVKQDAGDEENPAVRAAMKEVESAEAWITMAGNGDGYAARYALLEANAIPGLDVLLDDPDAAEAMAEALRDGGEYEDDSALTVYAYALGKRGDVAALEALADFVEASWYLELRIAQDAATDSIFALLSDPRRVDTHHYSLEEQDAAVAAARAGSASSALETGEPPLCGLKYTLVDANGNPLTYVDDKGATVEASISCNSFKGDDLSIPVTEKSQVKVQGDIDKVKNGGGTFVEDYDGGKPSKRYNCAGFAFRELSSNQLSLNCDAPTMFKLMTRSGALREVGLAELKQIGDKVFYASTQESGNIKHVAEVSDTSLTGSTIVRAPDDHSGVFDAPIDADYFSSGGSGFFGGWSGTTYRWVDGQPNVKTSDGGGDSRYCQKDECGGKCDPNEQVCLNGTCVAKTPETSCELRSPSCCPGQDNSCTAPNAACFCDDYCQEAGDCCPDVCKVCDYCG